MNKLALTKKIPVLTYQTQYTKMFLGVWTTNCSITVLDKNFYNRVNNADPCQKPGNEIKVCLKDLNIIFYWSENFLEMFDKVVGQILTFQLSGQPSLKTIPTRRYAQNTKKIFF